MTPDYDRVRWLLADPDTGTIIAPEFALAVDFSRLNPDQVAAACEADEIDMIPADVLDEAVNLTNLLADGLRWRAWMATPYSTNRNPVTRGNHYAPPAEVRCAACEIVGNPFRLIDVRTAVVVPWDVMGDPRTYAMVCPECAEVAE